jgi:hypothetical protein
VGSLELAAAAVDGLLGLLLYRYLRSNFRRIGVDEWRRELNVVDRKRRARIGRAINRGDAVDDPRDAQLALEMIQQSKAIIDVFAAWTVLWLELGGAAVSIAAFVVTRGLLSGFLGAMSLVALIGWLLARLMRKRQARRFEAAYAANAQLARIIGDSGGRGGRSTVSGW